MPENTQQICKSAQTGHQMALGQMPPQPWPKAPKGRKWAPWPLESILRGVRGAVGTFGRPEGRSWPQGANPLTLNGRRQSPTNGDKRQQADAPQMWCHTSPYVALCGTACSVVHVRRSALTEARFMKRRVISISHPGPGSPLLH